MCRRQFNIICGANVLEWGEVHTRRCLHKTSACVPVSKEEKKKEFQVLIERC